MNLKRSRNSTSVLLSSSRPNSNRKGITISSTRQTKSSILFTKSILWISSINTIKKLKRLQIWLHSIPKGRRLRRRHYRSCHPHQYPHHRLINHPQEVSWKNSLIQSHLLLTRSLVLVIHRSRWAHHTTAAKIKLSSKQYLSKL